VELFDESGFDIYTCRALVKVEDDEEEPPARDVEAKLVMNEALENIWTRFYEVVELSDSLDADARDRLLMRWQKELSVFTSAFIGSSVTEWMNREDQVIVF
jgi:hypothetical protein